MNRRAWWTGASWLACLGLVLVVADGCLDTGCDCFTPEPEKTCGCTGVASDAGQAGRDMALPGPDLGPPPGPDAGGGGQGGGGGAGGGAGGMGGQGGGLDGGAQDATPDSGAEDLGPPDVDSALPCDPEGAVRPCVFASDAAPECVGASTCRGGAWTPCHVVAEVCSGADDDCDGLADEGEVCAECGDGLLQPDEGCDDGNREANDGCSAWCAIEPNPECGDGLDNDGDGLVDEEDPQCADDADPDEAS